jgi:hypothetical protein
MRLAALRMQANLSQRAAADAARNFWLSLHRVEQLIGAEL